MHRQAVQAAENEGRQHQQQPAFATVCYAAEALEKNAAQQQLFQNRREQQNIGRHRQRGALQHFHNHALVLQVVHAAFYAQCGHQHFVERVDGQHQRNIARRPQKFFAGKPAFPIMEITVCLLKVELQV